MIKSIVVMLTGLLLAQTGITQPAVYREGTMIIPHGALIDQQGVAFYSNIIFATEGQNLQNVELVSLQPSVPIGSPWLENEPAIYRDGELWIENGAVIQDDGVGDYYSNIVLQQDEGRSFSVVSAQRQSLVNVQSADVIGLTDGAAVEYVTVRVEGSQSSPCVGLKQPAFSMAEGGMEITVLIAEGMQAPNRTCAQVITPFATTIYIPVFDLDPGSYTVNVNGQAQANFDI